MNTRFSSDWCGVLAASLVGLASAAAHADGPLIDPTVPGEIIVGLTPDATITGVLAKFNQSWPGTTLIDAFEARKMYTLKLPAGVSEVVVSDIIEAWVNPNPLIPDANRPLRWGDASYTAQSGEGRTGTIYVNVAVNGGPLYAGQYVDGLLGITIAQQRSTGRGVVVAVVDTGIDATHPQLAGKVLPGFNFRTNSTDTADVGDGVDNDGDGSPDESVGHGTFVAGLVSRVAPEALLLPVVVLDDEGFCSVYDVAKAIFYAIDRGVEVINVSIGSTYDGAVLEEALMEAQSRGIVVVGAAGNINADRREFPASEDDFAFGVAALDELSIKAPFSSYAKQTFLSAPGTSKPLGGNPNVLDPNRSIYSLIPNSGYAAWEGTSLSAPLVSGAAALIRAQHPEWAPQASTWFAIHSLLATTAVNVDALNPPYAEKLGFGRVNISGAVNLGPVMPAVGDLNNDGAVDQLDLNKLLSDWGKVHSSADLNGSGSVEQLDLNLLLANWAP